MKKILSTFLTLAVLLCTSYISANQIKKYDPKNYLYDHQGNRKFVKLYIDHPLVESQCYSHRSPAICSEMINSMLQEDEAGSYIIIPIKKKHTTEDDEEDDDQFWECPYCGTMIPAYRNCCTNRKCPVYRHEFKDW